MLSWAWKKFYNLGAWSPRIKFNKTSWAEHDKTNRGMCAQDEIQWN